jgi:hypothetical protein
MIEKPPTFFGSIWADVKLRPLPYLVSVIVVSLVLIVAIAPNYGVM